MFPLPDDALTQIATTSGAVFADLFPLVAFVGGILLAIAIAVTIVRMLIIR